MAPPLARLYTLSFFLALVPTLLIAATLRLLAILPNDHAPRRRDRKRGSPTRALIVLGSGGHTAEMLDLLRDMRTWKCTHRTYVVSEGDAFSAGRAAEFERMLEKKEKKTIESGGKLTVDFEGEERELSEEEKKLDEGWNASKKSHTGPEYYDIAIVPRARKIHQPLLTTPFSALQCIWACFPILLGYKVPKATMNKDATASNALPDVVITNGPATAVILIYASILLRFFNVRGAQSTRKMKTMYVESVARVRTLSLSGKLLLPVVDRFLVQWEELKGKGGRAEYAGIVV